MSKFIISIRCLITCAVILTFYRPVFSQFEKYTIPAKWQLYSVKDQNVSFLMPRLPVKNELIKQCQGEQTQEYAAYTDGVVYIFRITFEIKPNETCAEKKNFDENNFIERVKTLKSEFQDAPNSENNSRKDSIIKLVGVNKVVQLVNDDKNKRWFELSIYGADENKAEVKKFFASLKTDKAALGKEIGVGALQTFGDDVSKSLIEVKNSNAGVNDSAENSKKIAVKIDSESSYLIRIVFQPKAKYTEAARQNQVQGIVRLRVAFLANGAIGNIAVISGLGFGLTEAAIAAARKMVFIPQQSFKTRSSVSKTVEYTFTIY